MQSKLEGEMLRFKVDSHLLLELGERLVARKSVALTELVKNSYDADATKVIIKFENVKKPSGTIIVQDNGEGMAFDTVKQSWMLIATDEKRRNYLSSRYNRTRVGSKGVGRFACRVISDRLILDTIGRNKKGKKERVRAIFNWNDFISGSEVNSIPVPYEVSLVSDETETCTTLILEDVKEPWTEDDIEEVHRDLLTLISPYPKPKEEKVVGEEDPGIQITIDSPEFPKFHGPITEEEFLKYSWGQLTGKITNSKPEYELYIRPSREIVESKPDRIFKNLGSMSFRIDYFVYRSDLFVDLEISVSKARQIGREKGGVRIYLDNFRVLPYGEPGDDWLELDSDRAGRITRFRELESFDASLERPMLLLPGNNQLFGAVFISRLSNPDIEPTITRSKLLENNAYKEMKKFVRLGIEWMTVQYARWAADMEKKERKKPNPLAHLERAMKRIEKERETLGSESYSEVTQLLDMAKESFKQREAEQISEISMLRVLASTGTMISILQHEISEMIGDIGFIQKNLEKYLDVLPKNEISGFQEIINELTDWTERVKEYGMQLGILIGRESRIRRRSYPLRTIVDRIKKAFKGHLDDYGIQFNNNVPPELKTPALYLCEIYAILLNLVTNSAKAVKKSKKRIIEVRAMREPEGVRITLLDSGPGVPANRREEVFKPFVSDSEPDPVFGQGTGLGLTIVRNLIATYGGSVRFIDPPDNWGACVEIYLPE